MKKTLIAIAAIAAMGAASAEVTVYGKLDVGASVKTTTGAADQGVQFGSSNYEGSRIGVKGSTDLGNGIKGIFQVEGGLGATDGSFSGFGREAFLGLTGSFGTVAVGKMWTPYDSAFNDALEYNGFSAMGSAWYNGIHGDNGMDGSGASKNAIQYTTPTVNGLNAAVMYGSNADATTTSSATNYTSVGVNYANGPVAVNFATEKVQTSVHLGDMGGAVATNAWIVAASYNLGVATVHLGLEAATAEESGYSVKDTGSSVGVSVPLNKATTFALGYATETTDLGAAGMGYQGKSKSIGAQVVYNWSASTAIYGGYRKTDSTSWMDGTDSTSTKFAAGVRHNF